MELQGKVIAVLPEKSGVSARGEWKAQSYVIETHEQYPKKLCFDVFGADRIAQFNIQSGEELLVSFDLDAHEYNGRWFNSVRAWYAARCCRIPSYGCCANGCRSCSCASSRCYSSIPCFSASCSCTGW